LLVVRAKVSPPDPSREMFPLGTFVPADKEANAENHEEGGVTPFSKVELGM
jgi:hypothetical protein